MSEDNEIEHPPRLAFPRPRLASSDLQLNQAATIIPSLSQSQFCLLTLVSFFLSSSLELGTFLL